MTYSFWEKLELFALSKGLWRALLIIWVINLAVYIWLYLRFRLPTQQNSIFRENPPKDLSPGASRYIWKAEFDADCLLAAILSAVVKNVYRIKWMEEGFSIYLINQVQTAHLSLDEQAALSFNKTLYRERLSISRYRNKFSDKAEGRMEEVLQRQYRNYFFPRLWVLVGGILGSVLLLLASLYWYQPDYLLPTVKYIFMGLPMAGVGIYLGKLGASLKSWRVVLPALAMSLVSIGLMLEMEHAYSMYFFPMIFPFVIIHILFFWMMPRLTPKGQLIQIELNQFRTYLKQKVAGIKELDESEIYLLPYLIALEIEFYNAPYFNALLSEYKEMGVNPFQRLFRLP